LPWSKNVIEEQDAPLQVLFTSTDTRYDVHSNLGLWLEYHYELCPGENECVFSYYGLDEPIGITERMSLLLADSHSDDDFVLDGPGLVGTHSLCKLDVTFERGNGCSKVYVAFNFNDVRYFLTLMISFFRVTHTIMAGGRIAAKCIRHMLTPQLPLWMPRLLPLCVKKVWLCTWWMRCLA
jgi:hypothetical protein